MPGQPTVHSQEEAVRVLLAHQVMEGGIETQPSWNDTVETPAGWAFFNANGYLGTVTKNGNVIEEKEFGEDE